MALRIVRRIVGSERVLALHGWLNRTEGDWGVPESHYDAIGVEKTDARK